MLQVLDGTGNPGIVTSPFAFVLFVRAWQNESFDPRLTGFSQFRGFLIASLRDECPIVSILGKLSSLCFSESTELIASLYRTGQTFVRVYWTDVI